MSCLLNFAVAMGILFVTGLIGYWIGGQASAQKVGVLQEQLRQAEEQKSETEAVLMELRTEAQTATLRYEQLQDDVEEQVPEGPMQELVTLIRKQLEEGMDAERLAFAIRSARPPRNCTEPETRRFVISTPAYKGSESKVEIAEAGLVIKGSGASAKNEKGDPEAWYDPAKAVEISFKAKGAEEVVKNSVMPIRHSVVVGDREYRLSVEEAARSFAKVTFDSCDYP
ncbi:MAG: hypothetical protein KDJ35_06220 [Alphaproteobacteria bacterium]|nr:hypothetical protein [Alphaproteobacteria bacterium]